MTAFDPPLKIASNPGHGVIRKVTFPGVNMDIGHVRPIGFSKDNDKNTWIAYNKLRGQYMSALEHAIPERFFNDPTKCNAEGTTTPVLGLPVCPQGISAVKAIGLAASQGQKIYTITQTVYQNNPNIVNANLSAHSAATKQAVQNALDIGHEVTIHEAPITQSGWTGAGYTTIDPATGAGGYMIDGGSNGGYKDHLTSSTGVRLLSMFGVNAPPSSYSAPDLIGVIDVATLAIYSAVNTISEVWDCYQAQIGEAVKTIILVLAVAALVAALILSGGGLGAAVVAALALLLGPTAASAAQSGRPACAPPKMRVQFQESPRASGTQTYNTYAATIEGQPGIGVTTRQVRDKMAEMFDNKPAWMPGGVDLRGMIIETSEYIKIYPPFGTSGIGTEQIYKAQKEYNGLYYRVDLENLTGVNLKE